jgi:hypothetical protein
MIRGSVRSETPRSSILTLARIVGVKGDLLILDRWMDRRPGMNWGRRMGRKGKFGGVEVGEVYDHGPAFGVWVSMLAH